MPDLLGALCIIIVAVAFLTLAGHGLWVMTATIVRALFRPGVARFDDDDRVDRELRELAATRRQLERLRDAGHVETDIFDRLRACIDQRRRQLLGSEPNLGEPFQLPARHPAKPLAEDHHARQSTTPIRPEEAILDVLPLEEGSLAGASTGLEAAQPEVKSSPPLILPPRPRPSLGQVLAAFMEERNILWGELAGGLLIVGCSAALVVYLWQTQKQIPYFPFFVVAGVTASPFAAGLYTLHRWKLATTSRGLLIIATLLVPLSFLVMAGLSRGREGGWVEAGIDIAALGLFAWLLGLAGRVLAGPAILPGATDGRWLLTGAVLAASGVQLLVPRFVNADQPVPWSLLLLGFLPVTCYGLALGLVLWRMRDGEPLHSRQAQTLFAFLGMSTFPLAVALGFLVYWCADPAGALQQIAPLVTLAGVPVLATGLQVHAA
jgi:hypothetical protein